MEIRQKLLGIGLLCSSVLLLQSCGKSKPPPSEESADPPMISMESAVPEEQPSGQFKLAVQSKDAAVGFVSEKPIDAELDVGSANGKPLPKLKMKETNFIVIGKDAKDFQRIKPTQSADGKLQVAFTFPHDGDYEGCLQFTTSDGKNYTEVAPLHVGKGKTGIATLTPDKSFSKEVDGYRFQLVDAPETASDKMIAMPTIRITKDQRPISNIEPIDGKAGYAIVIKEGEEDFQRTIPVTSESANKLFQQPVMFHVKVPEGGTYRLWAQFNIDGAVHTVNYTFTVAPKA
jgi:hypothetical protein